MALVPVWDGLSAGETHSDCWRKRGGDWGGIIGSCRKCSIPIYGAVCLELGNPPCFLSGSLSCLFFSVSSPSPPHPPSSLWPPQTQHCMTFQLRFLKVSRETVDWLPAGHGEGGQGAGNPLVQKVQTSHRPPRMPQASPCPRALASKFGVPTKSGEACRKLGV